MADVITPEISKRICHHMNDDHQDAVLLYAKVYGNSPAAEAAEMLEIDPQGMNLKTIINGESSTIRISFDHELVDSEDAHQTLIQMVRSARSR